MGLHLNLSGQASGFVSNYKFIFIGEVWIWFFFFLALIRRGLGREEAAGWVEDRKIPVSRGKGFLLEMALIPMDVEPVSAV